MLTTVYMIRNQAILFSIAVRVVGRHPAVPQTSEVVLQPGSVSFLKGSGDSLSSIPAPAISAFVRKGHRATKNQRERRRDNDDLPRIVLHNLVELIPVHLYVLPGRPDSLENSHACRNHLNDFSAILKLFLQCGTQKANGSYDDDGVQSMRPTRQCPDLCNIGRTETLHCQRA
jgi:hypothetical protein